MKTKFNIICILLVALVAACGTSKKATEQDGASNDVNQGDITRPPVFVKNGQLNTETNPNETFSAEEWQKEQEAKE